MRLYLDTSVLNRPFDDQKQPRIWLETLAFSLVLSLIEAGEAELIFSPIHTLENSRSRLSVRRLWVDRCLRLATHSVTLTDAIRTRAHELVGSGRNHSTLCTSPAPSPPEPIVSSLVTTG